MAYDVTASFSTEQAKLEGAYPIDMIALRVESSGEGEDETFLYFANLNQDVYGFELNATGDLQTTATVYTGLPLTIGNFSTNAEGKVPSVTISIPNTDRVIESVIQTQDYLRSQEVYLLSTFSRFLPASSLDYRYIGEIGDNNSVIKEKLYIAAVTSNENTVEFQCKPKFDLRNAQIPRRRFSKECCWDYLGSECDPNGIIDSDSYPTCDYTLESCRERGNSARFGGFPSIPQKSIYIV